MKSGRKRRAFIEEIPEYEGFKYDRERDIYVKLPVMALTPEQRKAVGEFTHIKTDDPSNPRFLKVVLEQTEKYTDPTLRFRAVVEARNLLAVIATFGYPFHDLVSGLDKHIDKTIPPACRAIYRRLVTDPPTATLEAECVRLITSHVHSGLWPTWEKDVARIEVEARARR
jgi:hypothetical protein